MGVAEAFGKMCLIAVFTGSGFLKIHGFRAFRRHVSATAPWVGRLSGLLAFAVPVAEFCVAGFLLVRPQEWVGFAVAAFLLTAFTAYLLVLLLSESPASCGCVGSDDVPVSGAHIVRNILLLAVCAATWWASVYSADPKLIHYVLVAAPAVVMGIAMLYLGELVSLFRAAYVK
ncbi:MauE/DoxX family redox-associated membrane protein [Streptomyces europaeiscabiei]|uniref:MauE/DoxX family redox-associated membrane protein n=1 Tax=Streptomyces europaeiscabiei TaxID=146819 RepID=UPI003990AFD2